MKRRITALVAVFVALFALTAASSVQDPTSYTNVAVTGTLEVTGVTTLVGAVGVTGVLTVVNETVSGTLGVTGETTVVNVTASGTLDVTGVSTLGVVTGTTIDGTADVTAGSGANTVVSSATGTVYAGTARPTFEIMVTAPEFIANVGSPVNALIGSANAQGWAMDAAADESISGMFKVPDGFAAVDVTCSIGWSTTGTTDTQAVYFDLITVPTAPGEDTGVAGNTDTGNGALDGSAIANELNETAIVVAASTEWAADDIVYFSVSRDADHGSDDLAADVSVHYLRCVGTATDVQ